MIEWAFVLVAFTGAGKPVTIVNEVFKYEFNCLTAVQIYNRRALANKNKADMSKWGTACVEIRPYIPPK